MGMDVLECCMKHLPKTFCLIAVLFSGQMFGSVIDSLLLLHDLLFTSVDLLLLLANFPFPWNIL